MVIFTEKQIKILKGNFKNIGCACGCTREYASKVIKGHYKGHGTKAKCVINKAKDMLKILKQDEN